MSFLDDDKQKPLDNDAEIDQILDRLDNYKDEMENMMAFLNEVTSENKLKQDITAIQSTVDIAVPMVKTQLKFLDEQADDFVDLNDEIEAEIAMMRQLTTFDHCNDRGDQENLEPIAEHILGAESATVVEWVRAKRHRREKRAKRKQRLA